MPGFRLASCIHMLLFSESRNPGWGKKLRCGDVAFEELMRHPSAGVRQAIGNLSLELRRYTMEAIQGESRKEP